MNETSIALRRASLVLLTAMATAVLLTCKLLSTGAGVILLFGRWDVMVCGLIAALPLAVLATNCLPCTHRSWTSCIGCGCLTLAVVIIVVEQSLSVPGSLDGITLAVFRWAVASLLTIAVVLVCTLTGTKIRLPIFAKRSWTTAVMLALFALLVPAAYVSAVADGIGIDLENSLDSRRYALAQKQARTMLELTPDSNVNGRTIANLLPEIQQIVVHLETEIQRPLQRDAPAAAIGRRITLLMHLDRTDDALRLLSPLARNPQFQPICLDYQGLCWQRQCQYTKSLAAYQTAVAYWQSQPESDGKLASLASAWKGIGFAARRLGDRTLEEHAYCTLVDLAPTAGNHFLLAQCYSEHQKTKLAAEHSMIAVQIDPKLQFQSSSMLTSMSRDHFGCLQIPKLILRTEISR